MNVLSMIMNVDKGPTRRWIARLLSLALLWMLASFVSVSGQTYQLTQTDSTALEEVLVERYYSSDTDQKADTNSDHLPAGAITYRIFLGMKPGYSLQVVYGSPAHELFIRTSTVFFNNQTDRAETGFNVDPKHIQTGTSAFDSWITIGAATRGYTGIPLDEDQDDFSFIQDKPSLKKADGLVKAVLPKFQMFNLDLSPFASDTLANEFSTNNGGWAALGGVKGPTARNRVLVAQITTTGLLSFRLNVQLGTPDGNTVRFVPDNPAAGEVVCQKLVYNLKP